MKRAKILVIEGSDGSGKETQSIKLYNYLTNKGIKVKRYSFPLYDSATGRIVGGPYLGKEEICESYFKETSANVDPLVSILYYIADMRYNFLKEIEEEIYKNDLIILDRYVTSNMGHQVGKANSINDKEKIYNFLDKLVFDLCELPRMDKVIFLHMPFEAAKDLRKSREHTDGNESNEEHLKNAEKAYLEASKKYNWDYINCLKTNEYKDINDIKSIDEISNEVIKLTEDLLKMEVKNIKKLTRF